MSFRDLARHIPESEDPSIPELLFRAFVKNEITERDYFVGTAAWVAENLNKYKPRYVLPMHEAISSYVKGRLAEKRELDNALGSKLGLWVAIAIKAIEDNWADESLLTWCLDKTSSVGLKTESELLREGIARFERVITPPDLIAALAVQKLDSDARQRAGNRS